LQFSKAANGSAIRGFYSGLSQNSGNHSIAGRELPRAGAVRSRSDRMSFVVADFLSYALQHVRIKRFAEDS
jgi:hypothetical protein